MTSSRPRALLLDVGVVLFRSAWEMIEEFEQWAGVPAGTIPWRGPLEPEGDPLWRRHMAGEITEHDYWFAFADACEAAGVDPAPYDHVMRAVFQAGYTDIVRPRARELVDRCEEVGLPVGLLTNELVALHGEKWVRDFEMFDRFDPIVDAERLGTRKPAPEPYLAALSGLAMDAHEVVFIDDNPRYVEGARRLGITGVWLDVSDPAAAFDRAAALLGL
ncbi:MAG TPA: HAD family hydrolase [Acidimicrobiales bacterium]|nr:HAD family hydrolase [Acidimicrobiales bacterium]